MAGPNSEKIQKINKALSRETKDKQKEKVVQSEGKTTKKETK